MYQPAAARFKSEDPLPDGEPILLGVSKDHFARNKYEYARNNPINRVDPSGLDSTPITYEGETYAVSESEESYRNATGGNRFILVNRINEDAKAVFVAIAVQGAVYRQGRDTAQSVMSALQRKESIGNFTTRDFLRAMFGADPDRLAQPEGLSECEKQALAAAQEAFREYEKALQETKRLFDLLGFDKFELEGNTRTGSFPGAFNRGTGFNTAVDIVQQWVPNPRDYDGIQAANLEVEIASLFIPIPGIGRLAGFASRGASAVASRLVPRAFRVVVQSVLEFAASKSKQFVLKPVSETTKHLLERMGAAGRRALKWFGDFEEGLPEGFDLANGFASFDAFKKAFGNAGPGQAWHHIVEQTINSGKFAAELLHNPANLIRLPHGPGSIHARISGYYSSKVPGLTGDLTVREWLSTKSFKEQFEFGIDVIKQFGGSEYLPPGWR